MTGRECPEVLVVETGTANLASVLAALERAGARPQTTTSAAEIERAGAVVLPGVGAFRAAMDRLRAAGLTGPLAARVRDGRSLLAICLGMQLLAESSDESPGVAGLGVVTGHLRRFDAAVRVPQLGWNRVEPQPGCRLIEPGSAYFANSYVVDAVPDGWSAAASEHGGRFVSALERGPVLACQFHPELSGAWGHALISRWLHRSVSC
jgi:imidazole glycerol phosphate synthase glutamine amidotransferase subunit